MYNALMLVPAVPMRVPAVPMVVMEGKHGEGVLTVGGMSIRGLLGVETLMGIPFYGTY